MSDNQQTLSYRELLDFCAKCAGEKLADDVIGLDCSRISSVADYVLIATAGSEPQLRAISSFMERQVREVYQKRTLNQPDDASSGWVLLDFGNLIVHLMTQEMRGRYNLEGLWGDNPAVEVFEKLSSLPQA